MRSAERYAALLALGALAWLLPALAYASDLPGHQAEEVRRAELPNGLRVIAVRSRLAPVVTTILTYLVGASESPEGFPGMAHAEEHLMFRGSPGLSGGQLLKIGALLGGNFNAVTDETVTQFFFTVPADDLDVVLQLEAIRMVDVLDSEELWGKERDAIQQEVAQYLSNAEFLSSRQIQSSLFEGSVYQHEVLGTPSSVKRTTAAMLHAFHRTWYAPNNAILVIVGDIEPANAVAAVRKHFGGIPARRVPKRSSVAMGAVRTATFAFDTDQPQGLVTISFRLPGSNSPDFAAGTVLCDALANKKTELNALVKRGIANSAEFSFEPQPAASIGSARFRFSKGADSAALVAAAREQLAGIRLSGIASDIVEAAKRRRVLRAELEKTSTWSLAVAWSRAAATKGRSSPDDDQAAIQNVTAADVNRVAREYIDLDHAVVTVLTPKSSAEPVPWNSSPRRKASVTEQTQPVILPRRAAKALRRMPAPTTTLRPSVSVLGNGLELIVQTVPSGRALIVSGRVEIEPGLEVPEGKEGVDEILQQLFSFGTASLDPEAFQQALDDIGAEESAGAGFSLSVLADDFERGVELLADNELRPTLSGESFRTVQSRLSASVAARRQTPAYLADRALRAGLLPAGDPRLREATAETVEALRPADVQDYHRRAFRPDRTKIVVVGNVSPERVRQVFARYFEEWRGDGPAPNVSLPRVPPNEPSSTVVPNEARRQSEVTLAQTLGITRADPDYYALELGNHTLIGAFGATRLYRDLRDETGLVYRVSSTIETQRTRAFYRLRFACDPRNVSRARDIAIRDLEWMRTSLVSPGELHQAKALLLRGIALAEGSSETIASGLLLRASEGLPLDEPLHAAERYASLTAPEVRAAFARWLRPHGFVEVTEGPDIR